MSKLLFVVAILMFSCANAQIDIPSGLSPACFNAFADFDVGDPKFEPELSNYVDAIQDQFQFYEDVVVASDLGNCNFPVGQFQVPRNDNNIVTINSTGLIRGADAYSAKCLKAGAARCTFAFDAGDELSGCFPNTQREENILFECFPKECVDEASRFADGVTIFSVDDCIVSDGLSTDEIVAIVVGVLVAVSLIVGCIYYRRKERANENKFSLVNSPESDSNEPVRSRGVEPPTAWAQNRNSTALDEVSSRSYVPPVTWEENKTNNMALDMKNVQSWSSEDVKVWISGIGAGYRGYAEEVYDLGADGSDLIETFDEVIAEINFSKNFHRSKLQKEWNSIVDKQQVQ